MRAQAQSKSTTDHEEIREWVESRGGHPACVRGTGKKGDTGLLRIDYPGYSGKETLQEISWDEFFEKFDENHLSFLYQDKPNSRFSKLVNDTGAGTAKKKTASHRSGSSRANAQNASTRTTPSKRTPASNQTTGAKKTAAKKATAKTSRSAQTTIDHDEIREWVEKRGGNPACVRGTGGKGDPGMLRIDYPGYTGEGKLMPLDWDKWFDAFDKNNLAFLYQDTPRSRFSKLVERESQPNKRTTAKSAGAANKKRTTAKSASSADTKKRTVAKSASRTGTKKGTTAKSASRTGTKNRAR